MKRPYFFVDEEHERATGRRRIIGQRDSFWRSYFAGREIGVPPCCCLRYAFQEWREWDRDQAGERGVAISWLGWEFVPCGIFHRAAFTRAEYEERAS